MAFKDIACFLYGFDVTPSNRYIPFRASFGGPILQAVMTLGNYTATEFMAEMKSAMEIADNANTYTITLNRSITAGHENRMTIVTSGSYLDLLYGTGTGVPSTPATLTGFANSDYTGATSYTGFQSAGTILIPEFPTYNYLDVDKIVRNDGVKNVTANGIKETLVFAQMPFFQGEWKYINNKSGTQLTQWQNFLKYATRQLKFEFTGDIGDPDNIVPCTLESTTADQNGLAYKLDQMIDVGLYRFYKTGLLTFRKNIF